MLWRWRDHSTAKRVGCRMRGTRTIRFQKRGPQPTAQNTECWNEVSAPDRCAKTHAANLPWRKWQVGTNQASRTENNREFEKILKAHEII